MYAIIKSGGKQYKVANGESISVEKLEADIGEKVSFDVLLTSGEKGVKIGTPVLKEVKVTGEVIKQYKDKKIVVYRYKAKKNIRKKQGHRQPYTLVKITEISV